MIERIDAALKDRDIVLRDALLVRGGRWWSYRCDDPGCCPSDGTEIPVDTEIAAAHALAGRSLLPSRDALRDQLKPVVVPPVIEQFRLHVEKLLDLTLQK